MTASGLEVVFENDHLVAVNKPHGLLVHRTRLAADAQEFALQIIRDQIGCKVYPVHRIDRKTSGVLLFGKSEKVNQQLQSIFRERKVIKKYLAITRGFVPSEGVIDYALINDDKSQEATTRFTLLEPFELAVPFGKFLTSRYSLVELNPSTGRHHQLRKHLAHIFHPIIGDRPHGCNKQNRLWKEKYNLDNMMLHAHSLQFNISQNETLKITAELSPQFTRALELLRLGNIL
jgi:tRNA pseudouridine65 synthase